MGRVLVAATLVVAVVALATTAAVAAPSPRAVLIVSPSAVHRGHLLLLGGSANGCLRGDTVTLMSRAFSHTHDFAGLPALLTPVRTGGLFLTSTRIPSSRSPGRYGITGRCGGGNLGFLVRITVLR